jgi:hypothetical protein
MPKIILTMITFIPPNINLLRNDEARGAYSNTPPNSQIEKRNTARIEAESQIEALELDGTLHPKIDALTLLWEDDAGLGTFNQLIQFTGLHFDLDISWSKTIATKLWTFCTGEHGTTLAWYESSPDVYTFRFTMAGTACAVMGADEVYLLCCFTNEVFKARCTRIDIQVTDKLGKIQINDVVNAVEAGKYCGFLNYSIINSKRGKYKGTTVYFGSRNGQKFGRLYDKFAESRGRETGTRYEVEFKESLANESYLAYSASANPERLATLSALLKGSFRLCERTSRNLIECPTLEFWQEFMDRISTVHLSIKITRQPTTIAKKIAWVRRNVSKSIGMLLDAIGWERLNNLLSHEIAFARTKYTKQDDRTIEEYRKYPGAVWDESDIFYNLI